MRKTTITALASAGLMAAPAMADAHVTLQPEEAPAGGFARLDVRVPNEEATRARPRSGEDAPGVRFVSTEPVPAGRPD